MLNIYLTYLCCWRLNVRNSRETWLPWSHRWCLPPRGNVQSWRHRTAHHLPTNEFVRTEWFYWLLGWWRGALLNVNVSRGQVAGEWRKGGGVMLSEKETSVTVTAWQARETSRKRHERSWQPTISFGVKERACWEPQWCADSTLSARTKHESVSTHNMLICLSQQIHQLNYKVYWQQVNRCNPSTVMPVD